MLQFDAETTRQLEIAYQGADVTQRRRASFDALGPEPGETILDIGCGNGLLTRELARAVGPFGRIIGVDPSVDMRIAARARCDDFDWVELMDGAADRLPVADGVVDKAVSVQVFEYLDDIPAAVNDAHRVLKPGGRLVIGDIHLDSIVWFSDDPDRMARMFAAWDNHFTEPEVPAILPPILRDSGFAVDRIVPHTLCDHVLRPDGLASIMMHLMESYAVSNGHVAAGEARAWAEEQAELARAGRFFFSITHYVVSARKH